VQAAGSAGAAVQLSNPLFLSLLFIHLQQKRMNTVRQSLP